MEVYMAVPQYDSVTALKMLNAFVPITRFNKGEAGKIIDEVKKDGIRVIVKNNVPECIMITVEEYDKLSTAANKKIVLNQSKEDEEKRKALIKKIRANVQPPMPPSMSVEERIQFLKETGPIHVDEDAVNELRRISII